MKKTIICLLILSMLLWIPSCGTSKNDSYSFSLNLNNVRRLYKAAMESEETYNETLAEISPDMECTRQKFLKLIDQFKDHVVIFVPNSGRYVQYEINFELKGAGIDTEEGTLHKTSVNMVRQKYTRGTDACRAEGIFYSSSSPESIYDTPMQEMIQSGMLVDIFSLSDLYGWHGFREFDGDEYRYGCKEAYIYQTDEYNLYYFYIYQEDETYVGSFEFKAYKEEDGNIPNFSWDDLHFFSFMTLGEYVKG